MTADLARALALVADDLERRRRYPAHGIVRQAATELATRPPQREPGRCDNCGRPLDGRQRRWCSQACRRRHRP